MRRCEIVYVGRKQGGNEKGWRWKSVGDGRAQMSERTFPLFYECVMAARSRGYQPDIKCL